MTRAPLLILIPLLLLASCRTAPARTAEAAPALTPSDLPNGTWTEAALGTDFAKQVASRAAAKLGLNTEESQTLRLQALYVQSGGGTAVRAYLTVKSSSGWKTMTVEFNRDADGNWK